MIKIILHRPPKTFILRVVRKAVRITHLFLGNEKLTDSNALALAQIEAAIDPYAAPAETSSSRFLV